jgi:cyanate permease
VQEDARFALARTRALVQRNGLVGVAGPWFFGALIDTGSRWSVFGGYLLGSVLMLAAALIAGRFGVAAERKPLESVSRPLAAAE